jgi:hypothetical protein
MNSHHQDKAKLRETFKRLKVGMIKWKDIDIKTQNLLIKYYGV